MRKSLVVLYGVLSYIVFVGVFLYAVAFVGNFGVPRSIDVPARSGPLPATVIDALLLGLFAVQHSVMARTGFKRWWARFVPPPIERSTYVLLASLSLALLFWQWRPLPAVLWRAEAPLAAAFLRGTQLLGWAIALLSTFMISHLDLFGLRQVWLHARGVPYRGSSFTTALLYRFVRHPVMLGFLIGFWATPELTVGHLLFAALTTGYIVVGIHLEERDLLNIHGEQYAAYRREVPTLVPLPKHGGRARAVRATR
jgi:protein-S-isoprenylcysteine O-methyltransferase Ste14